MNYVDKCETSIIDKQKYCLYRCNRVLEYKKLKDNDINSDRNKLVVELL